MGSLLSNLPRTDPQVLKQWENARISRQRYAAIGHVAASWSYFEAIIDSWIWALINRPGNVGVCLTGQMIGPGPRISAFIALVRELGSKSKWNQKLEDMAKDAIAMSESRNRAIHDVWNLSEPSQPLRQEATAKKKYVY